ncbi:MAG: SpoIID/LytB domain-containing protein [Oscillospiraceae bacterium]|nr:SpoIID/LytB domain-containing protein [Oscillospiraceae bacterium]
MRRTLRLVILCLALCATVGTGARAIENDMLKVGIKYGSNAMFSANLQNYDGAGCGYAMGYYDSGRVFVPLGMATTETKISVTVDDNVFIAGGVYYKDMPANYSEYIGAYHLQLLRRFDDYDSAAAAAAEYDGGFVAWLTDGFAVRIGQYRTPEGVERAMNGWSGSESAQIVSPSKTGVMVTVTGTDRILFYFDCGGLRSLSILPLSMDGEKPITWFRGYRYYGSFEYQRVTGGNISVINVVNIEDYTKGSVPYEIGGDKPIEAIKAQAVCARTYAALQTRHRSQGFDVCTTDDCQVYQGVAASNETTDRAVDETAGVYMYYNGKLAEAFYYSSNGGASEDAVNVWGGVVPYCKGKLDPYEETIASRIPKYNWTVTYTQSELTKRLQSKGVNIGTVKSVYVSEYTDVGNVLALTFVGTNGSKTIRRESCRTMLGLRSMRFHIGDSAPTASSFYANGKETVLSEISGVYTISGSGTVSQITSGASDTWVINSSGTQKLHNGSEPSQTQVTDTFVFNGSGWGHNVGMSQWGASAMAELGYDYRAILEFYYTGITIEGPDMTSDFDTEG